MHVLQYAEDNYSVSVSWFNHTKCYQKSPLLYFILSHNKKQVMFAINLEITFSSCNLLVWENS